MRVIKGVIVIIVSILLAQAAFTQSGKWVLDEDFCNDEIIHTTLIDTMPILLIEAISDDSGNHYNLFRYDEGTDFLGYKLRITKTLSNGKTDLAYGEQGNITHPDRIDFSPENIMFSDDGGIIVGGRTTNSRILRFYKFDTGGKLDLSFADNGVLEISTTDRYIAYDILKRNDTGFLIIAVENKTELFITAYDESGNIEEDYGFGGRVKMNIDEHITILWGFELKGNDEFALFAQIDNANGKYFLFKIDENGNINSEFGVQNLKNSFLDFVSINDIVLFDDNSLITAGWFKLNDSLIVSAMKFEKDGSIDTTFLNNIAKTFSFIEGREIVMVSSLEKIEENILACVSLSSSYDQEIRENVKKGFIKFISTDATDTPYPIQNTLEFFRDKDFNFELPSIFYSKKDTILTVNYREKKQDLHVYYQLKQYKYDISSSTIGIEDYVPNIVYPNPSTGNFSIENTAGLSHWTIHDMDGRLIKKGSFSNDKYDISTDAQSGTYILSLKDKRGNTRSQKIQIIKP